MTSEEDIDRRLLHAILEHMATNGGCPARGPFEKQHAPDSARLKALEERGLISQIDGRLYLSFEGLHACQREEADAYLEQCKRILPYLQEAWRSKPDTIHLLALSYLKKYKDLSFIFQDNNWKWETVLGRLLTFFLGTGRIRSAQDRNTGHPTRLDLEPLLYINEMDIDPPRDEPNHELAQNLVHEFLQSIDVSGYRAFDRLSAAFGDLTVIIGANATGKSSLLDFLRFLSFAASSPLPSEIDPRSAGKLLFHSGGEERIAFAVSIGEGTPALRYEVEIRGPIGSAQVASERLELHASNLEEPQRLLDFLNGRGTVHDPASPTPKRTPWTLPPNELALRRAIDPSLKILSKFQSVLASFRFYTGFDIGPTASIRRPVHIEESPILAEDGANLSSVIHSIVLEHRDVLDELETHLRAAIPGFLSLSSKPRGGRGMAIGTWRESGVPDELTFADLSDGTLRLLCWLTLALAPNSPPLICIDEPEIGLHPRTIPILAGAFRLASERTQLLIATHSPYFLSQFSLDEIAVMRKENGSAVFVRPASNEALRREVEEIGGDVLARLFISDELEVRS